MVKPKLRRRQLMFGQRLVKIEGYKYDVEIKELNDSFE